MFVRFFRRNRHVWLSYIVWQRRVVFIGGAVGVGLVAIAFAWGAEWANNSRHDLFLQYRWLPFVLAPAGFALIAWITQEWVPGARGSGIPQAIIAISHADDLVRRKLLSIPVVFAKILLTIAGLFCGASIGREGPTVQVGASIMYALSRITHFPQESMRSGLILAGSAAGVAAAFNAPLAGVVFAIEEMSRSFRHRSNAIVLTAVITAGITSLAISGNYAYFGRTDAALEFNRGWVAVLVCGVVGGMAGGAFSRALLSLGFLPERVARFRREFPIRFAAACGLAMAVIGLVSGNAIFGTGYEETRALLEGRGEVASTFGVLKLVASVVSYASGIPGGIFAPSLAVGAGLGDNIAMLMPNVPLAAVILLGMVGYFSGVVQAPITAFVIVVEMTRDATMVLPLMACSLIAYGASRLVCPRPLYKELAKGFRPAGVAPRPSLAEPPEAPPAPRA